MTQKTVSRGKRTINPDLIKERENCSFDPLEITNILDEDPKKTEERRKTEDWFLKDPLLQDPVPSEFLSHKEKYEEAIRKACVVFKKLEQMEGGFENYSLKKDLLDLDLVKLKAQGLVLPSAQHLMRRTN